MNIKILHDSENESGAVLEENLVPVMQSFPFMSLQLVVQGEFDRTAEVMQHTGLTVIRLLKETLLHLSGRPSGGWK